MDSLIEPMDLFLKAKELGQSAIAVTDHGTLSAAWDSLQASKKTGVKLIMGCEFNFVDELSNVDARLRHIILLATNQKGYRNLLLLNKLAGDNNIINFKRAIPRIDWKLLENHSEGLICTTACGGGILGYLINTRRFEEATKQAKRLKDIFGERLALEVQPHNLLRTSNAYNCDEDQKIVNYRLINLGKELGIKVVAATDAHYLRKDQSEAHDAMLAIGAGQPIKSGARLRYISEHCNGEFYVKSRDEVVKFFSRLYKEKAEEFCDNTIYFADMCEDPVWIDPKFTNPSGRELPEFPVKNQPDYQDFLSWKKNNELNSLKKEDVLYLQYSVNKNFKCPADKEEEYRARINKEIEVLEMKDLCSYMLIVADYVSWAKKQKNSCRPRKRLMWRKSSWTFFRHS